MKLQTTHRPATRRPQNTQTNRLPTPDARRARQDGLLDHNVLPKSDRELAGTSPAVLKGIGPSMAKKLQVLGIDTVGQLAHSEADLKLLGKGSRSVLAVRSALKENVNHKERARRTHLSALRAIGDLPKQRADAYRAAARDYLEAHRYEMDAGDLDDDAWEAAVDSALADPQIQRRTYLPDGETPVRAYTAEFDISSLSSESRLKCVFEGDEGFRAWTIS
jgi:hypothetical protein